MAGISQGISFAFREGKVLTVKVAKRKPRKRRPAEPSPAEGEVEVVQGPNNSTPMQFIREDRAHLLSFQRFGISKAHRHVLHSYEAGTKEKKSSGRIKSTSPRGNHMLQATLRTQPTKTLGTQCTYHSGAYQCPLGSTSFPQTMQVNDSFMNLLDHN